MSYYTYYDGNVVSGPATEQEVAIAIAKLPYFNLSDEDLTWVNSIDSVIDINSHKWYDCIKDMKEISRQFPGTLIKIHGDGDESEDLWDAYFLDGKSVIYKAEIYYPPFNIADLQ